MLCCTEKRRKHTLNKLQKLEDALRETGDTWDTGDTEENGDTEDTRLTGLTVLRHEIKPKKGEISDV